MKRVHFIGIGGAGMSGLARIFLEQGCLVTGADLYPCSSLCEELKKLGAHIQPDGFPLPSCDLVIYSPAIPASHPQRRKAQKRGIPCFSYPEMVGLFTKKRLTLAVAGTHGKTTTTALLAHLLEVAGRSPGYLVGGPLPLGNGRWGKGKYFVVEACEYQGSFFHLSPQHVVLTGVDFDHPDCYEGVEEVQRAFRRFLSLLPPAGVVVYRRDCLWSCQVLKGLPVKGISIGIEREADLCGRRLRLLKSGTEMEVCYRGETLGVLFSRLLGRHNAENLLCAVGLALALGIPFASIQRGVQTFQGVGRRLELLGEGRGVLVLDDYGHHPRAVEAVRKALRQRYPREKVFLVFQPHQYRRTYALFGEFAKALSRWDEVLLTEIYGARDTEEDKKRISSFQLALEVNRIGGKAEYFPHFSSVVDYLLKKAKPGDLLLTMGAGNVREVGEMFLQRTKGYRKSA